MTVFKTAAAKTVFSYDKRPCANCGKLIRWDGQSTPKIPDTRKQIADEKSAYQIVSILEGVIQRGTGRRLKELGRPLAGKTGTTNKSKDTWFIGFSPDLVVGVFVGFDDPKSMGKRETGSSAAAPIWGAFMKEALKETPPTPFRVPPGIKNVRVNAKTGRKAQAGDSNVIWEVFVTGTEPSDDYYILDTGIIGAEGLIDPYGEDPYGYGQFGYENYNNSKPVYNEPVYNDGNVEVYGLENQTPENSSFSYFSNRKRSGLLPKNNSENAPENNSENNAVRQPQVNPNHPAPVQQPPFQEEPRTVPITPDPNFTGTGGLY